MVYSRYNKGVKVDEIWFDDTEKYSALVANFNNVYNEMFFSPRETVLEHRVSETLINNLTLDRAEIKNNIRKNDRYKIRRSEREGIICMQKLISSSHEDMVIVELFDREYKLMCEAKGMQAKSIREELVRYAKEKMMVLSVAELEQEKVVFHAYVVDGSIARLLYSVSKFRGNTDSEKRNAVGRANRLLHYDDLMYFKNQGYSKYDWGGYSEEEELASISDFKAGFGGERQKTFYYKVTRSKILCIIWRILHKS